jgi:hypothetical protein
MNPIAFVQLCRSGDIVLILPILYEHHRQGRKVYCVVHKDFSQILDAASYVTPLIFTGEHRDIAGAIKLAKQYADEVVVTQAGPISIDLRNGGSVVTDLRTGKTIEARNFVERLWRNAGMWEKFHELPLIFDARNTVKESRAYRRQIPMPGRQKPLLAYSLQGYCSYFGDSSHLKSWIESTLFLDYDLMDLTYDPVLDRGNKQQHITDLLPLIEASDILITTNSLPLHIAYAFNTPTISLEPDGTPDGPGDPTYWRSEPRRHWIGRMGYAESVTKAGQDRIISILEEHGRTNRQGPTRELHLVP